VAATVVLGYRVDIASPDGVAARLVIHALGV
jgi:hypothetical protein